MDTVKPGLSSNESLPTSASSTNAPAVQNKLDQPGAKLITPKVLSKGVEHAKKRLRAFSIQKKTPIVPVVVPKITGTGSTTVLIGKLSNVKPSTPKVDDEPKLPKPPKPGANKKSIQDSYTNLQKRTLAEIEDMKRKMELVELGIPLGLICPTSTSEKAMPTKAMPPIKHFLDPAKVDEIIREAKKARDEGKKYKFDYQKVLPKYDNPFQRKKDDDKYKVLESRNRSDYDRERDKRKSDRYDSRRYSDHRRDDRDKYRSKERDKNKDRSKEKAQDKQEEKKAVDKEKEGEANVNLNDYLVCDSWSLDNEDKSNVSPKEDKTAKTSTSVSDVQSKAIPELVRTSALKNKNLLKEYTVDSPVRKMKIEKLQPVIDSFKFEIDPNDEEILDIFDEDSGIEKFSRQPKNSSIYSPTDLKTDYDETSKDPPMDANDDTFLESVIAEIKQEADLTEEMIQDKGLVEYDISPAKEDFDRVSITPELDDKMKESQSQSDYSGSYRSSESGYKSVDSYRLSMEKEIESEPAMSKSTVESLETWSFVLKICQPILFRHDKNKCYRETRTTPVICYTESPKLCNCVKDRSIVYKELALCKMNLVDRVYGCDQIPDSPAPKVRSWYPRASLFLSDNHTVPVCNEWEGDDLGHIDHVDDHAHNAGEDSRRRRSNTPQRSEEVLLNKEYQRFMKAVWPEVAEAKTETPRSTTPVQQEGRNKKKEEIEKEPEVKKTIKRTKLSSEGWSQESDFEEDGDKSKKMKIDKEKLRKRKHSSSTASSISDSEVETKRKKKLLKKKAIKKAKSKSAKKRRIGKKLLRKLKEKEKRKRKHSKAERSDDSDDDDSEKRSSRKRKKRKQQKLKKKILKRKKKESSSSSSSTSSDSSSDESDERSKKSKKTAPKRKRDKRRRKQSSSESAQSEDLFDVNILNNIKTERLTDDEKSKSLMDFSPRKQKPREIINVKELQNDFVGNNIHIKKEIIEDIEKETACEEPIETEVENETAVEVPGDVVEEIEATEEKNYIEEKAEVECIVELASPAPEVLPVPPPTDLPQPIPILDSMKIELPSIPMPPSPTQTHDNTHKSIVSPDVNTSGILSESYTYSDPSENSLCAKAIESVVDCDKFNEGYQQDYEMYEQLAMAYQSDVANQLMSPPVGEHRIETLVRSRNRGEIKCDWRVGISPSLMAHSDRPSRWGLKPGEVNIVLTSGGDFAPATTTTVRAPSPQPVYKIQSIANTRVDTAGNSGYDEAYMDTYGAADRLQYGDCFSEGEAAAVERRAPRLVSLDDRIDQALKNTVLGEVAKEEPVIEIVEGPEKGILITAGVTSDPGRVSKRVSFADGYKPGQDSDVEEPPVKKKRKARRVGCAWPCPLGHADHVALWDALPPPPPPPGSPPPPPRHAAPPLHLLRPPPLLPPLLPLPLPPRLHKHDSNSPIPAFIPTEPPPSLYNIP